MMVIGIHDEPQAGGLIDKYLIWKLLGFLAIGILIGFIIDFPHKFEIKIEVTNETQDWYDNVWDDLNSSTYQWTNMCCYPSNCPQAENNPELCTCIYMVQCFETPKKNSEIGLG